MIDMRRLMANPNFATNYKVHRSYGEWEKGRFTITKEQTLAYYGPVQSASPDDLVQFPEGDRQKGLMKFFCTPPNELHTTKEESETDKGEAFVSDVIEYENYLYKVIQVAPWQRYGYIRAFGYKIGGISKVG